MGGMWTMNGQTMERECRKDGRRVKVLSPGAIRMSGVDLYRTVPVAVW